MKKLILSILTTFISFTAFSQSCLPEGITFTTQEQIDNFQTDYPGCTEIEGSVLIEGEDIVNLNGLDVVSSIGGDLKIDGNDSLISLIGLDNLTLIGGTLYIGYFYYWGVFGNELLTDFNGLENLISIGGSLEIWGNDSLTSLTGLENLTSVGGSININYNQSLSSIISLNNVNVDSMASLSLTYNTDLCVCDVQWICDYLSNPGGFVDVYLNSPGCNSIIEITEGCGVTLYCLPFGNYYFLNQSDIDNFQSSFPECTELEGSVNIWGSEISNLNGLNTITSIEDNLEILYNYNGSLENLTGLDNLTYVGGMLRIVQNDDLINLHGLENLSSIGVLQISGNNNLENFSGLDGLTSSRLGFLIGDYNYGGNPSLSDISSLLNVTSMEGSFSRINIISNFSLTSLHGLDNIPPNSIEELSITYNPLLSICEVQSICEYLASPEANVEIENNAPNCNSVEEVEEACAAVSIEEVSLIQSITTSPNPFTTSTTLSYELQQPEMVSLSIYNHLGQIVYQTQENQPQGSQQLVWNAEGYAKGVYYYRLQVGDAIANGKAVKVR